MATILTCTDGAAYAGSIYQHSAWAAQRLGAGVEILHALEHHREHTQKIDLSGTIGIDARAELTEELTKLEEAQSRVARLKGKAILEDARAQLESLGVTQITATLRHGSLLETLQDLEPRADLVVVGKRGEHAGPSQSPLGSNLEELVRISIRPVLVAARSFRPLTRVLIAYDHSASAKKAVAFASSSPLFRGLECHLLMVGRSDAAHESALNDAKNQLATSGLNPKAQLLPGNAATVIAEQVQSHTIDLLVMGAYGHSHIREFFVGSTTTKLVRGCSIPVLMFR